MTIRNVSMFLRAYILVMMASSVLAEVSTAGQSEVHWCAQGALNCSAVHQQAQSQSLLQSLRSFSRTGHPDGDDDDDDEPDADAKLHPIIRPPMDSEELEEYEELRKAKWAETVIMAEMSPHGKVLLVDVLELAMIMAMTNVSHFVANYQMVPFHDDDQLPHFPKHSAQDSHRLVHFLSKSLENFLSALYKYFDRHETDDIRKVCPPTIGSLKICMDIAFCVTSSKHDEHHVATLRSFVLASELKGRFYNGEWEKLVTALKGADADVDVGDVKEKLPAGWEAWNNCSAVHQHQLARFQSVS